MSNINKSVSYSQEKDIAAYLNGKVQANSGGTRFGGGDVLTAKFLIEAKTQTREQKSVAIKKEWLIKAREQAFEQGKSYSAVAIRFEPEGDDYFVISRRDMQTFVCYIEDRI